MSWLDRRPEGVGRECQVDERSPEREAHRLDETLPAPRPSSCWWFPGGPRPREPGPRGLAAQCRGELGAGGEPLVGVFAQGFIERRVDRVGDIGLLGPGPRGRVVDVLVEERDPVSALERSEAGEHLVGDHGQGVLVGPAVARLAPRLARARRRRGSRRRSSRCGCESPWRARGQES